MLAHATIKQLIQQFPDARLARLAGKSAWVVGAGSGYGKAAALLLLGAGCNPVFISGRSLEKLNQTRNMAMAMGLNADCCLPVPVDITNELSIEQAIQRIEESIPSLYALVLTAAVPQLPFTQTPLLSYSREQWDAMIATNLSATFFLVKSALKLLVASEQSRIVCFTSKAAWSDTLGFGPYNISKCALNAYVASVARELKHNYPGNDIQINAIEPGEAFTEMNQGSGTSPLVISKILLSLLTTHPAGPSGKFFDRDMNAIAFNAVDAYSETL